VSGLAGQKTRRRPEREADGGLNGLWIAQVIAGEFDPSVRARTELAGRSRAFISQLASQLADFPKAFLGKGAFLQKNRLI